MITQVVRIITTTTDISIKHYIHFYPGAGELPWSWERREEQSNKLESWVMMIDTQ